MVHGEGAGESVALVAEAVREGVMRGRYAPGQRLPESDLAAECSASRGTVRNALAQLESEGIVVREPHRGARVRVVSLDEAVEITEARAVLEGLCAAKAAQSITPSGQQALRDLGTDLRAAVDKNDVLAYTGFTQQVHKAIREMAGHGTAASLLNRLHTQSVRYHYPVALLPGRPTTGAREHLDVIDSVCARDPDRAEQTMRAHLVSVAEALRQLDTRMHR